MKIKIIDGVFIRHNDIDDNRASIWFLHGFADSGLAYKEVFASKLTTVANLYVVDFPGFGASPIHSKHESIKEQADLLSKIISQETKNKAKISIVAHSIGALIGTWLAAKHSENIAYFFNIEGNLTLADSYFSSKPLQFETAEDFVKSFEGEIFANAIVDERFRRYYSSLKFAVPQGMRNWAITSQDHIKNDTCRFEFKNLSCNKVYVWGDLDTPKETQDFIQRHRIPHKLFKGIGHWHMVENAKNLYQYIGETLATTDAN